MFTRRFIICFFCVLCMCPMGELRAEYPGESFLRSVGGWFRKIFEGLSTPDSEHEPAFAPKPEPEPEPPPKPGPNTGPALPIHESGSQQSVGLRLCGPQALPQWLNSCNLGSFFSRMRQLCPSNDDCFITVSGDAEFDVWVDTYGFFSDYTSSASDPKAHFNLATFGLNIGMGYAVNDSLQVGVGMGYLHSNVRWKGSKCGETQMNSICFGPYIEHVFKKGMIGAMVYGVDNFSDPSKGKAYSNWNLGVRLEGGYDIPFPKLSDPKNFNLYPYLVLDYLAVFHPAQAFSVRDGAEAVLKDATSSFFHSKLAFRLSKTLVTRKAALLFANVDLGWANMTSFSDIGIKVKKEGAKEPDSSLKVDGKNQAIVGLELLGIHTKNILVSLKYEAAIGSQAPTQIGRLKVEWGL